MIDMAPSLALVVLIAVLVGTGVYLVLERTLTRVVVGTALITHGVNILILMAGGRAGAAPIIGTAPAENMSDPLPQAFVLTAIVISLAITAFAMSMAYRSWQLTGHDEVADDVEDRRIARVAALNEDRERVEDDAGTTLAEDAAAAIDETATDQDYGSEIVQQDPIPRPGARHERR